jgi:hypothetical protein
MTQETPQSYIALARMSREQARASKTPGARDALLELAEQYDRKAELLTALAPPPRVQYD